MRAPAIATALLSDNKSRPDASNPIRVPMTKWQQFRVFPSRIGFNAPAGIQYAAASRSIITALEHWITRFRG